MQLAKVYLLTHPFNDKVYVGYTSQKYVSNRLGKHRGEARKGTDTHLYRAMRKYGPEVFSWSALGEYSTESEAKNAERLWIILLRSDNPEFGYNMTRGGEAPKHTEESKRKISEVQKANPNPDHYKKITVLSKTPEARAKHSESMKKAWSEGKFSSVYGDNHWTRRIGRSEESCRKLSVSIKKAWDEGRHSGSKGKTRTPEQNQKTRDWFNTPEGLEFRQRMKKWWEDKRRAAR